MTQTGEFGYFKSGLALGMGVGVLGGVASTMWYQRQKTMDADLVLEKVKQAFLKEGPVEGSWIEFDQKPLRKFAIHSKIYTGGITRYEDGRLVQYAFSADAYTGTVIDVTRITD